MIDKLISDYLHVLDDLVGKGGRLDLGRPFHLPCEIVRDDLLPDRCLDPLFDEVSRFVPASKAPRRNRPSGQVAGTASATTDVSAKVEAGDSRRRYSQGYPFCSDIGRSASPVDAPPSQ